MELKNFHFQLRDLLQNEFEDLDDFEEDEDNSGLYSFASSPGESGNVGLSTQSNDGGTLVPNNINFQNYLRQMLNTENDQQTSTPIETNRPPPNILLNNITPMPVCMHRWNGMGFCFIAVPRSRKGATSSSEFEDPSSEF